MDKEALFKSRLAEREVELEGVGVVRVRALTRSEVMTLRGKSLAAEEMERRLLSLAMVDPELTQDEVRQWQAASPAAEIETVTNAIAELSGMKVSAAKEAYKSAGE